MRGLKYVPQRRFEEGKQSEKTVVLLHEGSSTSQGLERTLDSTVLDTSSTS